MNRALVALLSAFDSVIQAAVGIAVIGATLTLLWAFSPDAAWGALWPAITVIWQLSAFVPVEIVLPEALAASLGVTDSPSFIVSLAPLALTVFTVVFGIRSGARAARSGAWITGVIAGTLTALVLTAAIAIFGRNDVAVTALPLAIALPTLLYGASVLVGAVVTAWREDDPILGELRDRVDAWNPTVEPVAIAAIHGAVFAALAIVGVAALTTAVAVFVRGGEIVALFQAGNADLVGAIVLMVGQLAYLPTLIAWALAWVAGPGFAVGDGTSVSPISTDVGVVPALPVLGALPEVQGTFLLVVILLPVAAGALGGAAARSYLHRELPATGSTDRFAPRLVCALVLAALCAGAAAAVAGAASGSIGPGSLAVVGPHPGMMALVVGGEVLLGAAILLLLPADVAHGVDRWHRADAGAGDDTAEITPPRPEDRVHSGSDAETAPIRVDGKKPGLDS